ncbi:MAG: VOC family protein [Azoarcus sp.]|nr:VOC family protein [Azoarcus sp.]
MENVPAFKSGATTGGTLTFYFETDDIDGLAARIRGACEVVRDLHDTFYGMREIYVRDPNGYVLGFAQPLRRA